MCDPAGDDQTGCQGLEVEAQNNAATSGSIASDDVTRLGRCQRCSVQPARYTCPGCGECTCSLACSLAHKSATGCTGRRDPAKYLALSQFTDADLLSDYRFLESVDHSLDRVVRLRQSMGPPGGCGRSLSRQQRELQEACQRPERSVQLQFMPQGMARRRANRSHLRRQRGGATDAPAALHWTVEVRFQSSSGSAGNSSSRKFATASDATRLSELLQRWRHLWPAAAADGGSDCKPECCLCRQDLGDRLCPVDWDQSLCQILRGTAVIEYPVFVVRERAAAAASAVVGET